MRHKIISVSAAKAQLLRLVRRADEEGEAFVLTRDGSPLAALVPIEDYESLLETADVLSDPVARRDLQEALEDESRGRLWKRDRRGRWVRAGRGHGAAPKRVA